MKTRQNCWVGIRSLSSVRLIISITLFQSWTKCARSITRGTGSLSRAPSVMSSFVQTVRINTRTVRSTRRLLTLGTDSFNVKPIKNYVSRCQWQSPGQGFIVALNECMLKITRGHHRGCGGRGRGHRPPAPHHRRQGDPGE